jgi:hypothetical protein
LAKSSNLTATVTNQADEEARWGKPNRYPDKTMNDNSPHHAATWVATLMSALDAPLCRLTAYQIENKKLKFSQQIEIPCISNFSQLSQADVDSDGQAELLFLTFTPTPYSLSKIQTLHAYHVGTELTEMATLTGTLNGADGVGIRWEKDATGKLTFLTGLPLVNWWGCGAKLLACMTTERRFERYQWQDGQLKKN